MTEVTIELGAMSKSLVEQLEPFGLPVKTCERLERNKEAISQLYFSNLIPASQADKARDKLVKLIQKEISKHQKQG